MRCGVTIGVESEMDRIIALSHYIRTRLTSEGQKKECFARKERAADKNDIQVRMKYFLGADIWFVVADMRRKLEKQEENVRSSLVSHLIGYGRKGYQQWMIEKNRVHVNTSFMNKRIMNVNAPLQWVKFNRYDRNCFR